MKRVRKYRVAYSYGQGFGEINLIQKEYKPITYGVLEEARELIKSNFPEGTNIVIISWQRYESEE